MFGLASYLRVTGLFQYNHFLMSHIELSADLTEINYYRLH